MKRAIQSSAFAFVVLLLSACFDQAAQSEELTSSNPELVTDCPNDPWDKQGAEFPHQRFMDWMFTDEAPYDRLYFLERPPHFIWDANPFNIFIEDGMKRLSDQIRFSLPSSFNLVGGYQIRLHYKSVDEYESYLKGNDGSELRERASTIQLDVSETEYDKAVKQIKSKYPTDQLQYFSPTPSCRIWRVVDGFLVKKVKGFLSPNLSPSKIIRCLGAIPYIYLGYSNAQKIYNDERLFPYIDGKLIYNSSSAPTSYFRDIGNERVALNKPGTTVCQARAVLFFRAAAECKKKNNPVFLKRLSELPPETQKQFADSCEVVGIKIKR